MSPLAPARPVDRRLSIAANASSFASRARISSRSSSVGIGILAMFTFTAGCHRSAFRPHNPRLAVAEFATFYYFSSGGAKSFLQFLVIDWFRQVVIDARLQSLIAFLI